MRAGEAPWIRSAAYDCVWFLGPAFAATAAALAMRGRWDGTTSVPVGAWVLLIVGVDVAHVYGTLYRTYLDPVARARRGSLLLLVPALGWAAGAALYAVSGALFWSALAYLAVFHFVRQQYGFVALYSRREVFPGGFPGGSWRRRIDQAAVYMATLYPLLYWHTHLPRNFSWFVSGDFVRIPWPWVERAGFALYVAALGAYAAKALYLSFRRRSWNLPRDLWIAGTALSWYAGIVLLNGDLAFTLTNVAAHGIPYLALVWCYGRRARPAGWLYRPAALPVFLGALVALAFVEEGLWDGFVWRDHPSVFGAFAALPRITEPARLAWLAPLLALPQITHYCLDGFIWRLRGRRGAEGAPA